MKTIYQVVCDHNRYGEWIAGTYDNEGAAANHKRWSDGRLNGWDNFSPAEIRRVEVQSEFVKNQERGGDAK